jgi:hypothetical protein
VLLYLRAGVWVGTKFSDPPGAIRVGFVFSARLMVNALRVREEFQIDDSN